MERQQYSIPNQMAAIALYGRASAYDRAPVLAAFPGLVTAAREWRLIAPLLSNKPRGVARVDDRRISNAILYVLRRGSPWRDLPNRYGPYTTAYNRYNRWSKAGVRLRIFGTLAAQSPGSLHVIRPAILTP